MRILLLVCPLVLGLVSAAMAEEDAVALEEVAFADIDAAIAESEGLVFVDLYADW